MFSLYKKSIIYIIKYKVSLYNINRNNINLNKKHKINN